MTIQYKRRDFSLLLLTLFAFTPAVWADTGTASAGFLDSIVFGITQFVNSLNSFVFAKVSLFGTEVNWIVLVLMTPMLFLTFYLGFINLRSFGIASKIIRGHYHDKEAPGEVTQFQALSTALSGTVGLGNITGVAMAIYLGGPGATFWMIIIGFFAMTLKFSEVTLAVKYREIEPDGTVNGGPMYYLKNSMKDKGIFLKRLGLILAWTYAILAIPSLLQIAQVNQSYALMDYVVGFESETAPWVFGVVIASLTALVIMGGIKSIAGVTSRLVPLMCGIYLLAAVFILLTHFSEIPAAIGIIIQGAFNPDAAYGGIIGVLVIGMKRAVYSTEAGLGSATIAHAAAKTREPVSEGMVALMEPFIDTVVVCSMTALVIIISGAYIPDGSAVSDFQITSKAFGSKISWFPYILAFAALLFAFSTIISWGYYTSKIWGFVFGKGTTSMGLFKFVFCLSLIPGAALKPQTVIDLMDAMFFLMALPNVIGIFIMAPLLKAELSNYLTRLRNGDIKETRDV
ncbi:alanine/glycine:cation symporter family protein [Temperatibacter marinus]|uniref:Alanine/glycine:cation symporter family protein n=1 Tax=Temperatibacter marinus TaxID=1456591 RepID=A0AA52H9F7_9PROT|nr:alanine/glycine:cation symporter family protein [Temperatibacter marinus]WND02859.1 alanine/glycine:cation symporter family protein [Temperatibacter marinus]